MEKKSTFVAYVLWFLGGLHYIYLGRPIMTLLMWLSALTLIGVVWWIVDFFRVPGLVAGYNRELEAKVRAEQRREAMDTALLGVLDRLAKE